MNIRPSMGGLNEPSASLHVFLYLSWLCGMIIPDSSSNTHRSPTRVPSLRATRTTTCCGCTWRLGGPSRASCSAPRPSSRSISSPTGTSSCASATAAPRRYEAGLWQLRARTRHCGESEGCLKSESLSNLYGEEGWLVCGFVLESLIYKTMFD